MAWNKAWFLLLFSFFLSCNRSSFPKGENSYKIHCSSCHMDDGSGLKEMIPDLYFQKKETDHFLKTPCFIRNGLSSADKIFQMIPNKEIDEIDITNIINYIANDMNNLDTVISLEQTREILQNCD